jgi:hypothetical protein
MLTPSSKVTSLARTVLARKVLTMIGTHALIRYRLATDDALHEAHWWHQFPHEIFSRLQKTTDLQLDAMADSNPTVFNRERDLWGRNTGYSAELQWDRHPRATKTIILRALSREGPWESVGVTFSSGVRDVTSEARRSDLWYRVEALEDSGGVLGTSEPLCIPRFVEG